MQIVKIISSEIDKLNRRVVKFLRFGKSDVQTALQVSPFGLDSGPTKDMVAVYSQTSGTGETVIIGYINKKELVEPGESRLYSTDSNGELKFYVHLKKDGTMWLNGGDDNLVRYIPLNQFVNDLKQFLTTELGLIATGITTGGGSYTPGSPTFDISDAKINEIKTT